jgi:hypothetical protein
MNASFDLERRLADFYATEAPPRAPDWVLTAALTTIDTIPQRRTPISAPWRFPIMNTYAKVATAAVAVVAVGAVGLAVLRPGQPESGGMANPSPSLSSPAASGQGALPSALAPTETFTSSVHGISIGYPAGWAVDPATGPGTVRGWSFRDPGGDTIYDPQLEDHLFMHVRSEPIGDTPADEWMANDPTLGECEQTEPVTIAGVAGVGCAGGNAAVVVTGGRGYMIVLYASGDDAWLADTYTPAWFRTVLDTVRLDPASAAPPMPDADARYDSTAYGLSIAHPSAWTITPGNGPWLSGLPFETADTIERGSDGGFLRIASQPLAGRTGQAWASEITGMSEWEDTCDFNMDPITIDGTEGQFVIHCPSDVFNGLAWTEDRGYLIVGYEIGDTAWFKDVLGSVRLTP